SLPPEKRVHNLRSGCHRGGGFKRAGGRRCCRPPDRFYSPPPLLSCTNRSRDEGFCSASRLTARSGGVPARILLTGTSSFLPFNVRGTSSTTTNRLGTCRGESSSRSASRSRGSTSANSTPCSSTRKQ